MRVEKRRPELDWQRGMRRWHWKEVKETEIEYSKRRMESQGQKAASSPSELQGPQFEGKAP